jgi:hypothetical protein
MSVSTYGNFTGESASANALSLAVIVGTAFLVFGVLASVTSIPVAPVARATTIASNSTIDEVVVVAARPRRMS